MIVARLSRLILNSVGTVSVVNDVCRNEIVTRRFNLDIEEVTARCLRSSVWSDSVNGKHALIGGLVSRFKSRSFRVRLVRRSEALVFGDWDGVRRVSAMNTV